MARNPAHGSASPASHRAIAYNPGIMRRCLLAVFVLHLLWNMAGVVIVARPHERPGDALHAPLGGSSAHAPVGDTQGLADRTHGLLDDVPDLPDSMLRIAAVRASSPLAGSHAGWSGTARADPLPDALFRPPQRT